MLPLLKGYELILTGLGAVSRKLKEFKLNWSNSIGRDSSSSGSAFVSGVSVGSKANVFVGYSILYCSIF